jgi:hypothetical protein
MAGHFNLDDFHQTLAARSLASRTVIRDEFTVILVNFPMAGTCEVSITVWKAEVFGWVRGKRPLSAHLLCSLAIGEGANRVLNAGGAKL